MSTHTLDYTDHRTIESRVVSPERFATTYEYNLLNQQWEPTSDELAASVLRATDVALGGLAGNLDYMRSALGGIADDALDHAHRIEDEYATGATVSTLDTWWAGDGMAKQLRIATLLEVVADEVRAMAKSAYDHAERVSPREED